MFIPKKTKHKKQQKGKSFNKITTSQTLENRYFKTSGKTVLKAIEAGRLSSKNINTCKQTINKIIKKYGILNINIFANTPITNKPLEIRMGKGKGAVKEWVAKIKPGTILFEINTTFSLIALTAFKRIQNKLPINTQIIKVI